MDEKKNNQNESAPRSTIQSLKWFLRTFKYRNYRLFFIGQGLSLIGTWMQQVAMGWLVYRLTNSAYYLGLVGFVSMIPSFVITPFSGVLADRFQRKSILFFTQIFSMLQAFILALLVWKKWITIEQIIILSALLGVINAFDAPARQSFIIDIVNKEDLVNAIAMNSAMFNGARLVGPAIAGFIIELSGESGCFLVNALSFLAVIAALNAMKVKTHDSTETKKSHVFANLREGFVYSMKFAPIKYVLLLTTAVSLTGVPYACLLPIYAKEILKGGPKMLGFLMGGVGVGALIGAGFLASRKNPHNLWKTIAASSMIFGVGVTFFSQSRLIWFSMLMMLLCGFGLMVQLASTNTTLQTIVEDSKRGRVMGLYVLAFMGITPFGNLLAGAMANKIGAPNTLTILGFLSILSAIFFAKKVKNIHHFLSLENKASEAA